MGEVYVGKQKGDTQTCAHIYQIYQGLSVDLESLFHVVVCCHPASCSYFSGNAADTESWLQRCQAPSCCPKTGSVHMLN